MFERFTTAARDAVVQAQSEARELGQDQIGSEHVLLGTLWHADGVVKPVLDAAGLTYRRVRERVESSVGDSYPDADALRRIGIDLDEVRRRVEENFGAGALSRRASRRRGHLPFGAAAKKSLELALREAISLQHNYIGTEHILLGLTRLDHEPAVDVITAMGLAPLQVHDQIHDLLRKAA
ncbi:Clp protease N-terminal domain-containing protein [Microlunatus elymi]|nr:Clp protease N-terminal domain-containing protein [Microlunatus elymi]